MASPVHTEAACVQVLGLEAGAGAAEVKAAYKQHCLLWHPDKHSGVLPLLHMMLGERRCIALQVLGAAPRRSSVPPARMRWRLGGTESLAVQRFLWWRLAARARVFAAMRSALAIHGFGKSGKETRP